MSARQPHNLKSSTSTERKTSTSTYVGSSRPRVPSASIPENERRNSTTTHTRRQSAVNTASERRTDRIQVLSRETVTARTRSPLKHTTESRVNARTRDTERLTKPAERASASSVGAKRGNDETKGMLWCRNSALCNYGTISNRNLRSTMGPPSFSYTSHNSTSCIADICTPSGIIGSPAAPAPTAEPAVS